MSDQAPFGFELGESLDVAKKLLAGRTGSPLAKWPERTRLWLNVKDALRTAIDPRTGREEMPIAKEQPTPGQAYSDFQAACHFLGAAEFASYVTHQEALDDYLAAKGSMACTVNAKIKGGMKLGRAFAIFFKAKYTFVRDMPAEFANTAWCQRLMRKWMANRRRKGEPEDPPNNDKFVDLVTDEFKALRARAQEGTLVLSANPLDLLMMSWHSPGFTTCHGPEGCHKGGPQQYLADGHTAVAYLYKERTPLEELPGGPELPAKVWRQLVHIDLVGQAASFMRHYPAKAARYETQVLTLVAAAIARHHKHEPNEPGWTAKDYLVRNHRCSPVEGDSANEDSRNGLVYIDKLDLLGQRAIRNGVPHPAVLPLSKRPQCLGCDELLLQTGLLLCQKCSASSICATCSKSYGREGRLVGPDGSSYCKSCYDKRYRNCTGCGEVCRTNAFFTHSNSDGVRGVLCNNCHAKQCFTCDICRTNWSNDCRSDMKERVICKRCHADYYGTCQVCKKVTERTALSCSRLRLSDAPGMVTCDACRDAHNRKAEGAVDATKWASSFSVHYQRYMVSLNEAKSMWKEACDERGRGQ